MVKPSQTVDVFATYEGDANHLPSFSSRQAITFTAPVELCISPATASVAAGATINYTAAGGVTPVRWYLDWDSTCSASGTGCSTINETTGVLKAGTGAAGYVIVTAVDADGAETFSEVTVAGGGTGIVPWSSSGPPNYSGILVSRTALTSCPAGDNCGTISNGCGGTVTCGGTCPSLQTCGGGGTPNQCGCTSTGTCTSGAACGSGTDNCGNAISCGTCNLPQTCGGGGVAGQCGCTITSCAAQGAACGTIPDGCGGTLTCPSCPSGDTCVANQCIAPMIDAGIDSGPPDAATPDASAVDAGLADAGAPDAAAAPDAADTDGGAADTGAPDTGAADTGAPDAGSSDACAPTTCAAAGAQCGSIGDGCGGSVDCGSCPGASESCVQNQCVVSAMDAGHPADAGRSDSGAPRKDAAAQDSGEDAGAGDTTGSDSGCSCRTAKPSSAPAPSMLGAVALVAGACIRRRRRRR